MRFALYRRSPGLLAVLLALPACVAGGISDRGGPSDRPAIHHAATLTYGAPYKVVCIDEAEVLRRESLPEEELRTLGPPVRYVAMLEYQGGCEREGQTSVFFLFNMWPVTDPLNPQYAIAQAVQPLEGDSMVGMHSWHETHYLSLLGRVAVWKVKGDVIVFLRDEELRAWERANRRRVR